MAPTPAELHTLLNDTIGAFILGTFASLVLYGVFILQVFRYTRLYPNDEIAIKALVLFVFILQTFHVILPMHACYYYLINNYLNFSALQNGIWSINLVPGVAGFITLASQGFFARRVSLIGPKIRVLAAVAVLFFLGHASLSIVISYEAFHEEALTVFAEKTAHITPVTLFLAVGADFLLSGAIILALYRSRHSRARKNIPKSELLGMYILNTGLLTGIVHLIAAILSLTQPKGLSWGAAGMVAQRLYAITLLAVLNSRSAAKLRGMELFNDTDWTGRNVIAQAKQLTTAERFNVPTIPDQTPSVIHIKVAAETEVYGQPPAHASSLLVFDRRALSSPTSL
ncbi:hypothetical protein C8Q79DRAFT_946666 [Trametes meyenii]|nr:hypothetical protein C8Q79DRAFT_946666 [Trametes meyenii]